MFYRQKVLLSLLDAFGGELPSTDFQKYLFLFTRLCEKDRSYEFVPYKFGCFSFQSYGDKAKLIEQGFLEDQNDWKISNKDRNRPYLLKSDDRKKIDLFVTKYKKLKGRKLIEHVYKGYPYYAINSLIAKDILGEDEYSSVRRLKKRKRGNLFATIGYEGLTIEEYINKLIENDVRMLVDVRKNPLSRKYGFSKNKLSELLSRVGIEYLHIPELGIVSEKRSSLATRADYKKLFDEYERTVLVDQQPALTRLYETYVDRKRVAITCFEECHTMCHRHKVAEAVVPLANEGFVVKHL